MRIKIWLLWHWLGVVEKTRRIQDWIWDNITVSRINKKDNRLQARWRRKYGYNKWETWAPGEGILEHAMLVLKAYLKECSPNPQVEHFVNLADRYFRLNKADYPIDKYGHPDFDAGYRQRQDCREIEQQLYQELGDILKRQGAELWY